MPVDVRAPDGSIARFPDGMSDEAITEVMRQHYGGPAAAQQPFKATGLFDDLPNVQRAPSAPSGGQPPSAAGVSGLFDDLPNVSQAPRAGPFDDVIPGRGAASPQPSMAGPFYDLIPGKGTPPVAQTGGLEFHDHSPRTQERLLANGRGPQSGAEAGVLAAITPGARSPLQEMTGNDRTEYPNAQEFGPAYVAVNPKLGDEWNAINQSAISSDPLAQLDILKKRIPGLQSTKDKFGNIMLLAPGMKAFAYLNKPGLSGRDIDEFGTQTLATLPFMGIYGRGATLGARLATAAGSSAAGSIEQDALAQVAGSDRGIDLPAAAVSAGIGTAMAPGVPSSVARGIATGIDAATAPFRQAVRGFTNPEEQAARNVASAFAQDATGAVRPNITPEQLEQLGATRLATFSPEQDARLMDIGGETTRDLARSAANLSPQARENLLDVIQPRFATQSTRAVAAIRDIAGTQGVATQTQRGIETAARNMNDQLYGQAYRQGASGIMTPEIQRVMGAPDVQTAMEAARTTWANREAAGRTLTAVNGPSGHPTLEFWDQVARTLSDREGSLRIAGNMDAAATTGQLRRQLQDALDQAVPSFRAARGTAATFFGASDALDAGRRVALGQYTAADARDRVGERIATGRWTPGQIEQAMSRMGAHEQALFREGYVSAWVDKLHATGDNRNVVSLLDGSPQVRQQLETVLGPNRARQLQAFVGNERMMDRIRSAVSGNSTTARQLVQIGLATGAGALAADFDPRNPIGWLATFLTYKGIHHATGVADRRIALETAHMLTSNDPAVYSRGLRHLSLNTAMLNSLMAADRAFRGAPRAAVVNALEPAHSSEARQ